MLLQSQSQSQSYQYLWKKMIEKYCVYPSITFIFWVKVLRDSPQEVCQLV